MILNKTNNIIKKFLLLQSDCHILLKNLRVYAFPFVNYSIFITIKINKLPYSLLPL